MEWPIKNIWINNEIAFVEWHFKCNYKNRIGEFDGVSIIKFDEANKMISVKDFNQLLGMFIRMKIGLLSETIRAEVLFITFNFDFSKVSIFTNFHIKINIKSIN